jgi:hypothetical protein
MVAACRFGQSASGGKLIVLHIKLHPGITIGGFARKSPRFAGKRSSKCNSMKSLLVLLGICFVYQLDV